MTKLLLMNEFIYTKLKILAHLHIFLELNVVIDHIHSIKKNLFLFNA